MNMKRKICLYLVIAMIISLFSANANADSSTVKKIEKLRFLNELKIINSEYDSAEDIVSRENFALFTARLLNMDVDKKSKIRFFADVEQNSYAANAINLLTEAGYISGYDDDHFRPLEAITMEEACCILMKIMNYAQYAKKYSDGSKYTCTAKELDIIKNINPKQKLCVADAAELLVNAGITGCGVISEMSGTNAKYTTDDERTILSIYRSIYCKSGTITDIYGGSIDGDCILNEGYIRIDGTEYSVDESVDVEMYFGKHVTYFYYADNRDDSGNVFFISDYSSKLDSVTIDIDLFKSLDANSLVHEVEGSNRTKKYKLTNPAIVYNGYPLSTEVEQTLSELNRGSITLTDRNNDSNYDTVIINDYKNFVVGSVDVNNKRIYSLLNSDDVLSLNDYNAYHFVDTDGNEIDLKKLSKYTVVSVKRSKYTAVRVMSAIASDSVIHGVLRSVYDDEHAVIDDDEYKVDKSYFSSFLENVYVGNTYYFRTDAFGNIAYVTPEAYEGFKYGYLLKQSYLLDEIDYDGLYFRLLTEENNISKLSCAEKVTVDGKKFKKREDALKYLVSENGTIAGNTYTVNSQMIRYTLNAEEEVTGIDTLIFDNRYESEENSIKSIYNGSNEEWWFNINRLGIKAVLDSDTKVFCVPSNDDNPDSEQCMVGKYNEFFTSDQYYSADAFYSGTQSDFADAVIYYYSSAGKRKQFFVTKIEQGLNDDNEPVTKLSGFENGVQKTVDVDNEISLSNIKEGDLLVMEYDFRGRVIKSGNVSEDIIKVYDAEQEQIIGWNNVTEDYTRYASGTANKYRNDDMQFSFGYVKTNNNGVITISNTCGGDVVEAVYASGTKVIIYDRERRKDKAYIGTGNDIIDYRSAGEKCDKVIICSKGPGISCVYVFR